MSCWIEFSSGLDGRFHLTLVICLVTVTAAAVASLVSFRKPRSKIASVSQDTQISQISHLQPFHFNSKRRVVIFDFDNVLTSQEVKEVSRSKALSAFSVLSALKKAFLGDAFGGEERVALLDAFLENLSQGAYLGIVSRNRREVIEASLSSVDLVRHFHFIVGREDFEDSIPKSKVIQDFLTEHPNLNKHDLLFVDDMFLNVSDVSQHCHVPTLHIRKAGGIDTWDCDYILNWARHTSSSCSTSGTSLTWSLCLVQRHWGTVLLCPSKGNWVERNRQTWSLKITAREDAAPLRSKPQDIGFGMPRTRRLRSWNNYIEFLQWC